MAKVYLSSTLLDLKPEREAVTRWLIAAGHLPVHSYVADSESVHVSCLKDIDPCDLYVLILGHRYGFVPEEGNPGQLATPNWSSVTPANWACRASPCCAPACRTST